MGILAAEGWIELCSLGLVTFADTGLQFEASDREVWLFVQENDMILLTDNRNMKGKDSLESTIRKENTKASLPVLTISNVNRFVEKNYREQCASQLVEIILDLENYRGTGRLFIP